MPATPDIATLTRFADLIKQGFEPDEAGEVVFGSTPPAPPKPDVMVTEFPDGVVIGWDHCTQANGGCGKSVRACTCKGGPKELKVFEQWRSGERQMPDYAAAGRAAKAAGVPTSGALPQGETGLVVGDAATGARTVTQPKGHTQPKGQVPCKTGEHLVPIEEAEKNDDGTWTCFACQEAG